MAAATFAAHCAARVVDAITRLTVVGRIFR
jgi:hypothetical protein